MKRISRPSKLRPTIDLPDLFRTVGYDSAVVLIRGEDFDCAASTAAEEIRSEWRRMYGNVTTTVDGDTVTVFVDPGKAQS